MSRFLLHVTCFCLLQAVLASLLWVCGGRGESNEYHSAVLDKYQRLADQPGRRLIFVGGSNLAFGIDSQTFKDQLAYEPVNLGVNAGLGLESPLRQVKKLARSGDVVVICPEYHLLIGWWDGLANTKAMLFQRSPEAARYFGVEHSTKEFLDRDGLAFIASRVRNAFSNLGAQRRGNVYRRNGFNQYGDMVAHYDAPPRPQPPLPLPDFSDDTLAESVRRLNEFHAVCQDRGVLVYFAHCPYPTTMFAESAATIRRIEDRLRADLRIPRLTDAAELTFPPEQFFDTEFHLTRSGVVQRSGLLVERLGTQLARVASEPNRRR